MDTYLNIGLQKSTEPFTAVVDNFLSNITIVIGPRGSGKTRYVKEKFYTEKTLYLDYTADSRAATAADVTEYANNNPGATIILDDVTRECVKKIDWDKLKDTNTWILVGQYEKYFPKWLRNMSRMSRMIRTN